MSIQDTISSAIAKVEAQIEQIYAQGTDPPGYLLQQLAYLKLARGSSGGGSLTQEELSNAIEAESFLGTNITGASVPTGGSGLKGWLSALWKLFSERLMPPGNKTAYLGTSSGALLKNSSGNIYAITVSNGGSSMRYFQIFDKATAPALNDVPVRSFPVPPDDSLLLIGQDIIGGDGIPLSTGVAWGFSSTRFTYTAATATDCIATVRWS